jgi:hypothetical protein
MKFKPMLRFALIGFLLLIAADVTAQVSGNNAAIDASVRSCLRLRSGMIRYGLAGLPTYFSVWGFFKL